MIRSILAALSLACVCFAQSSVVQEELPPAVGVQLLLTYSGGNLSYLCRARSIVSSRESRSVSISAATNANPAVFTVPSPHGFDATMKPKIKITGATGNWAVLNRSWTALITSTTTFTLVDETGTPVDSTSYGALTGTLILRTQAPRTIIGEWAVKRFFYDAGGNMISSAWENGSPSAYLSVCAASTTTNLQ